MVAAHAPLRGYVVADFTHVFAGPFATQALADAGATVIKIEPPDGEFTRNQGPWRQGTDGRPLRAWAASLNAGKHSIALDLKDPSARDVAEKIALASDVVVENFRTGTMATLGLDPRRLRALKPELVTCSIALRGAPAAGDGTVRAGLSIVAEAEGTLTGTQRDATGTPVPFGFALADIATGMTAYGAIVTALVGRARGAPGTHLDVSMVASVLAMNGAGVATAQVGPQDPDAPTGNPAAMGVFATKDGHVTIGVNSDHMFRRFCEASGLTWMLADERYARQRARDSRVGEVNAHVAAWASTLTAREVVEILTRAKVPSGQVTSPADVLVAENGLTSFVRPIDVGDDAPLFIPVNPYTYDAGDGIFRDPVTSSPVVDALLRPGPPKGTSMKFFLEYPVRSAPPGDWIDPRKIAEVARTLEEVGFDGLGFTDHPAPSAKWLDGGGHDTFDPFAAMAFCAGMTSTLTLFSHLLVVPYRNPLLQASSIASVDVLAAGRTVFVLGAGYLRSEFAALGVDFDERNALFDEGVDAIKGFMAGDDFSYQGRHFTALGQRMRPLAAQHPHPPLWLGGNSSTVLDRIARWGDGWAVMMGPKDLPKTTRTRSISTIDELGEVIADLGQRAESHGRSLADISVKATHPALRVGAGIGVEEQRDALGRLVDIGVTWAQVELGHHGVGETLDQLRALGETVIAPSRLTAT